jgi:hypothetical protein
LKTHSPLNSGGIVAAGKFVAGLLLVASCLWGAQAALAQEAGKRDLSGYERGGDLTLRYQYEQPPEDEAEVTARSRKLLWARWLERRRAHFAIVKIYTHGDSTTINYYVEPDEEGRWRVAVEHESDCCSVDAVVGEARVRKITRSESYYVVGRVDAVSGRAVPEGEARRPETYKLLIRDGKPAGRAEAGVSRADVW